MALPSGKGDSLKQDLKKEESVIKKHTGVVCRDGYCNIWEHSKGMTGKVTF